MSFTELDFTNAYTHFISRSRVLFILFISALWRSLSVRRSFSVHLVIFLIPSSFLEAVAYSSIEFLPLRFNLHEIYLYMCTNQ